MTDQEPTASDAALDLMEQQIVGYKCCLEGYGLPGLIQAAGLTAEEWLMLRERDSLPLHRHEKELIDQVLEVTP